MRKNEPKKEAGQSDQNPLPCTCTRPVCQILTAAMPLNFELPTVQERIDGPDKLGASPGATNSAMGRLSAG